MPLSTIAQDRDPRHAPRPRRRVVADCRTAPSATARGQRAPDSSSPSSPSSIGTRSSSATLMLAGLGTVASLRRRFVLLGEWPSSLTRLIPLLRAMRHSERDRFNPTPLYLVMIPLAALVFQIAAAAPLTAGSLARAIASSAEMIADIEAYREAQGRYPNSLLGVWKDYYPRVVGVERYYSAPSGMRTTCILSSRALCWIRSARGSSWSTTRWMSISWSATPPLCCGSPQLSRIIPGWMKFTTRKPITGVISGSIRSFLAALASSSSHRRSQSSLPST